MVSYDVVVAGAGAAGMTAALAARARGLNALVVESTQQVGGTTATSAGTLWIPCVDDDAARTYLTACIGSGADRAKIDAFLQSGPELLGFLREQTQVRLQTVAPHPDYLQHMPGASLGGRAHAPVEFDGRLLGANFHRVRPPIPEFMVFGGMMVSKADIPALLSATRDLRSFRRAAALLARYIADRCRWPRGTRLVMGNALVAQLYASMLRAAIPVAFQTSLSSAVRSGNGFVCTMVSPHGASEVRTRSIVLATGGFSGDRMRREAWLPRSAVGQSVAHAGATGGGIALALELGGALELDHASPAFWMPVSSMRRRDGTMAHFPHIMLDRAKPGLIAIDTDARRFANEADSYHHFCAAMLANAARHADARFHLVADGAFVHRHGIGLIRPGLRTWRRFERAGYLVRARSPAELAARLRVNGDRLSQTLRDYNADAAHGIDRAYGRGESALNRHNGDPAQAPNPCVRPIDLDDLVAVQVRVADLATSVGVSTDADGQVLGQDRGPIAGLYACGNDMASVMRGAYPGPGTTLGPGMTFAWRIARHIAAT